MRACLVIIVIVHSLLTPFAWAEAGRDRADRLCTKAETAEREAREAERKSLERQRFLKGKGGVAHRNEAMPTAETSALRQSVKSRTAQARAILSQLRQSAAAASTDRVTVPGFSQYFTQMESSIGRMLQAIDSCLNNPVSCNIPQISCPPLPPIPAVKNSGSANLIRNVQQSYSQAANQARQACLDFNGELRGEVERLNRESRSASTKAALPASERAERFGEADLQLRRAESLKREALQARQEADRVSGVGGYCSVRSRTRMDSAKSRAVVAAFRSVGQRERRADPGIPLDGKVVDLKAGWERKWTNGGPLDDPGPTPLPVVRGGGDASNTPMSQDDLPDEFRVTWRDQAKNGYEQAASWYREADGQVELTEFLTPPSPREFLREQAKEGAKKVLVEIAGPFGKSVEAGLTILEAVKGTTEEIGEILEDAPRVIGSGSAADAQELADRAFRVPVLFLNSLFNEVTSEINLPEYSYQYKKEWGDRK
jgi:hypothetical protein